MTDRLYHVDGTILPAEEATVNVRDRGFMYGDAAFETLRLYGGEIFEWEAHAERLTRTCSRLGFEEAMPPAWDLRERVRETADANDLADAYARLSISRGVQPGKLTPAPRVAPTVVVVVDDLPRGGRAGEPVWDGPAQLETVARTRTSGGALPADIKTHNYLNGILARLELEDADEAIMLDTDGRVTEGATSNIFFVEGDRLKTPSSRLDLLPGVTRSVVLELAREEGIPVETGEYAPGRVRGADEVFVTNTTWELRPVAAVDGVEIGVGPLTKLLARLFDDAVERACY